MNRRSFLSNLHLPIAAAAVIPLSELAKPQEPIGILNIGHSICPYCGRLFDISQREGMGFQPGKREAIVQHPDFLVGPQTCPNAGKKFRLTLGTHGTEEI